MDLDTFVAAGVAIGGKTINQTQNMALRFGISLIAGYVGQQYTRLVKKVDDKPLYRELKELQSLLTTKIKVISPAIDLIELKSGRGNVFLESAVPLTKSLHKDIVSLGKRLEAAALAEEEKPAPPTTTTTHPANRAGASSSEQQQCRRQALRSIIADIKDLLARIDREIPLIQLAITASGESMSNAMPPGISPSRLMQASTFLSIGDTQFASDPTRPAQIGPSFTVSCYMIFLGHGEAKMGKVGGSGDLGGSSPAMPETPNGVGGGGPDGQTYGLGEGERKPIWQEVMHKARVRLCRTPAGWGFDRAAGYSPDPTSDLLGTASAGFSGRGTDAFARMDEFSYHLEMIEDLDDGRLHAEDGTGTEQQSYGDIMMAGIRESIPVHEISKIFYTDTGKILNIGDAAEGGNNPVLLLKRDIHATKFGRETVDDYDVEERREYSPAIQEVKDDGWSDSDSEDNEQTAMDRQLRLESETLDPPPRNTKRDQQRWEFPKHVDHEWIALEVYLDDDDDDVESSDEDDGGEEEEDMDSDFGRNGQLAVMNHRPDRSRSSVDSNLLAQIRNISLRESPSPGQRHQMAQPPSSHLEKTAGTTITESPESFVARSPFGGIASSLSLMEILIRLTSMQEFQQTSHLAIPDHILTFFLEETSTTGLHGEQRWKARKEVKRRVGFDPYTDADTPTK